MAKVNKNFVLISAGLLIGFINGFLGSGGGMIAVPLLRYVLKLSVKESHATAIFVILPMSVVSGITYLISGVCGVFPTLLVTLVSLAGALIGSVMLSKLKSNIISFIFCAIIIYAGVRMIL